MTEPRSQLNLRQPHETPPRQALGATPAGSTPTPRPVLSVHFVCANFYQRVLRDVDGSGYTARCAKCGIMKRFVVGPGGTGQREFKLDCGR